MKQNGIKVDARSLAVEVLTDLLEKIHGDEITITGAAGERILQRSAPDPDSGVVMVHPTDELAFTVRYKQ